MVFHKCQQAVSTWDNNQNLFTQTAAIRRIIEYYNIKLEFFYDFIYHSKLSNITNQWIKKSNEKGFFINSILKTLS
jgi:predicted ABC-type ATPase